MRKSSRGNPNHMPAGSSEGGRFCSKGVAGSMTVQNDDGYYEIRTEDRKLKRTGEENEELLLEAYDNNETIAGIDMPGHNQYVSEIIDKFVADGMETNITLTDEDGDYLPERRKQQKEIVNEILENTKARKERRVIVTGGLGGAGKTTVLKKYMHIDTDDYITVNPDDIKEIMAEKDMIPDVKGLTPMEASPLVHEEASDVSKMLMNRASKEGYNIIIDTTLSSENSAREKVNLLKKAGYTDIQPVFVDISPETSLERAQSRHKHGLDNFTEHHKGNGGRFLPEKLIDKAQPSNKKFNSKNAENLIRLHEDEVFTKRPIVFNNEGREPIEIEFNDFVKKGKKGV